MPELVGLATGAARAVFIGRAVPNTGLGRDSGEACYRGPFGAAREDALPQPANGALGANRCRGEPDLGAWPLSAGVTSPLLAGLARCPNTNRPPWPRDAERRGLVRRRSIGPLDFRGQAQ